METDCSFIDYTFINFGTSESLLTTSQYAKVIFHNVEERYSCDRDLVCEYSLTEQFSANAGDRVVLFRLGWQQVTDYVLFEWAPVPSGQSVLQVTLPAGSLPRDTSEFYQLCYLTGENAVCGASVPFQFAPGDGGMAASTYSECFLSLSQMDVSKATSGFSSQGSSLADATVKELASSSKPSAEAGLVEVQQENQQLRREILQTTSSLHRCTSQMQDLRSEVEDLKRIVRGTQSDVADLKQRMDHANDEYRKLYAEKARTEKKYERLVKKCQSKRRSVDAGNDTACDLLGELEPLPPFPLLI